MLINTKSIETAFKAKIIEWIYLGLFHNGRYKLVNID